MKRFIFTLYIVIISTSIEAGNKITGIILDQETNTCLEFVNIQLLNTDSVFIKGCVTNSSGEFILDNIDSGDFLLCASSIGYEKTYIAILNLSKNLSVGEITLHSTSINLDDITITASSIIKKVDRQIILPTKLQSKASTNGLTLLRNLQLPRIVINPVDNSIKLPGGENVQLRINGVEVSQAEVIALKPSDITKIEYHDNPGLRYNNAGAVIDFIVKQREKGGNISGNFTDGISNTGYGENNFSAKYNYKKSEFSTNVYWGRRNIKWIRENQEIFKFPTETVTRIEIGEPTKVKYDDINVAMNYNLQDHDNYLLNIRFRNNFNKSPNAINDRISVLYQDDDILSINDHTFSKGNIPSLDVYFQKSLRKDQQLIFNVVGTYMNTETKRNYTESLANITETNIYSKIDGTKYSLIAEGIYEKNFNSNKISAGIKHSQAYLENEYTGNITDVVNLHTAESYAYVEYQMGIRKFNYTVGLGAMRTYNSQRDLNSEKYIFRPSLKLAYSIKDNVFLRYNGYISGYSASLSDLNDISQEIDAFQIRRGNPNLKTVTYYSNDLTFSWYRERMALEIFGRYSSDKKPVMEHTYFENNKFIRSMENQKNFHRINLQASLQLLPYKEYVSLTLTPFMNRYISHGNTYTHTHTNFGFRGSIMAMYDKWTLIAEMNTSNHTLWGETLTKEEKLHSIIVGYNKEKWSISAGILNPFTKKYQIEIENLSNIAPNNQNAYSTKLSRIFFLSLSLNLDFGRSYHSGGKRIDNQDLDTGILSGKK